MNKNLDLLSSDLLEDQTCEWQPSLPNHPFHDFFDTIGEVSPIINHSLGYSTTNPFKRPDRSPSPDLTTDPFGCTSLTSPLSIPSQNPAPRMRLDISQYFQYSQTRAAKLLCVSPHSLCKSWRNVTNRKWPYRKLKRLDIAIATLDQNIKVNPSPFIKKHLKDLLQIRNAELLPIILTLDQ